MTDRFTADLHVHSRHSDASGNAGIRALRSAESFTDPLELYHAQNARGMDFVTITDHNTLSGSLAIAHLPGTFLSCELDTLVPRGRAARARGGPGHRRGHVRDGRRGARERPRPGGVLREAEVTHYLAHPLFDMSGELTPDTVERMLLLFNVLEGRNGARTRRSNGLLRAIAGRLTQEELEEMAERQGIEPYGETPWRKALTGGSDDHSGLFAASAYTEAGGDGTPQGFLRAIAAGDCTHRGIDGDSRTLAHSIYAASFWKIREILRLDEQEHQKRALGLLRKGFGRVGRDVPVLEKTLRGVRSMAPGLYRDGDPRGPSWEELLEREIGSLIDHPDGINAVDAKELNRRLFVVAQRLADDVMGMHLHALLEPHSRMGLKRRLQSLYAVGMVAFLEIPYYFAWSFQTRDRLLQEQLRVYFLGERRRTRREKIAVLCGWPETAAAPRTASPDGPDEACAAPVHLDVDLTLLTCSVDGEPAPRGAVDFRALAWRPSPNGDGPSWVVPPLVEIADYIEEEGFSAVHTDSAPGQGLVALVAARLLHLPVTGAVDAEGLRAPHGPGDIAGRLRRRYLTWFYGHLDEAFAPSRATARAARGRGRRPRADHRPAGDGPGRRGPAGPESWTRPALSARRGGTRPPVPSVRVGEQRVDPLARVAQDLERLLRVVGRAGHGDLLHGAGELEGGLPQREPRVLLAALAPRRVAELLLEGLGLCPAGLGQREHAPALALGALDQALVLEELERGVHRAGAGTPGAAGALLELLHDLVAVHGLVGERQQDGGADVAALGPGPGAAAEAGAEAVRAVPVAGRPPPRPALAAPAEAEARRAALAAGAVTAAVAVAAAPGSFFCLRARLRALCLM